MRRDMMFVVGALTLLALADAQGAGTEVQEGGPDITLRKCKSPGSCTKKKLKLTMDANWRWVHISGDYKNCYKGNLWIVDECKGDGAACGKHCQLEGISAEQYKGTYGVESIKNGEGVSMKLVNEHEYGISVGARLYMYDGTDKYEMFKMLNEEFAFDANMKELECGINGAVYFIEMTENGGKGTETNEAGPKFGTGYCDAQCPHDMKFIEGQANCIDWKANEKDKSGNMGIGKYGACCNEMDIWEANARAQALTPHPCTKDKSVGGPSGSLAGVLRCGDADHSSDDKDCGDNDKQQRYQGVCDKDGCDFAAWRMGNQKFYGKGSEFTIDTNKDLTQVTQFLTDDESDNGNLVEIRRVWKQGGKVIHNSDAPHLKKCLGGRPKDGGTSLDDEICKSQNEKFGDYNHFRYHGGHKAMGESLGRGHVLAISLWDDVDVSMMWLDSWFPRNKPKDQAGVDRGPCKGGEESTPTYVRNKYPEATVKYWNFAVGCLGCTTDGVEKGAKSKKKNLPGGKAGEEGDEEECKYAGDEDGGGDTPPRRRSDPKTRRRSSDPKTRRRTPPRRRSKPETRRRSSDPETRRRTPRRRSSDPETRRRTPRRRSKPETRRRSPRRRSDPKTRRRSSDPKTRRRRRGTR